MPTASQRPIVVLGAGCIGLTTAVRLLESPQVTRGRSVHVIAAHHPTDPLDARYASTIAGAHHLSFADDGDERQRRWDKRTFQVLYDEWLAVGESSGLMALTQTELWVGSKTHLKIYEEHPDFKVLDPATAPCKADHMVRFTSLTITPALYLASLERRLRSLGGHLHRAHVPSLASLSSPQFTALTRGTPSAVFVCTGLGALTLGGVADGKVYPTRGQVVRVRAPWVRHGWTRQLGSLDGGEGGQRTYVIPRCTGDVILGGTREEGDWEAYPREETKRDILTRVLEICPTLTPPNTRAEGDIATPKVAELEPLVVDHLVGFRPSRTGGTRLEKEQVAIGDSVVPVIHNYGHGGAGWQSSWATAEDAVELLGDGASAKL